eukprot:TRINITY_DN16905_c0_g1_i1.p1 TRINITY_DN16905_c0_g1~~TRINITY_DN16905_c0_g1_i1.p1  ORF type:complete len:430 (+),score=27.56 TRINITY_DN16905_c0_g1_i1:35-1324(+)
MADSQVKGRTMRKESERTRSAKRDSESLSPKRTRSPGASSRREESLSPKTSPFASPRDVEDELANSFRFRAWSPDRDRFASPRYGEDASPKPVRFRAWSPERDRSRGAGASGRSAASGLACSGNAVISCESTSTGKFASLRPPPLDHHRGGLPLSTTAAHTSRSSRNDVELLPPGSVSSPGVHRSRNNDLSRSPSPTSPAKDAAWRQNRRHSDPALLSPMSLARSHGDRRSYTYPIRTAQNPPGFSKQVSPTRRSHSLPQTRSSSSPVVRRVRFAEPEYVEDDVSVSSAASEEPAPPLVASFCELPTPQRMGHNKPSRDSIVGCLTDAKREAAEEPRADEQSTTRAQRRRASSFLRALSETILKRSPVQAMHSEQAMDGSCKKGKCTFWSGGSLLFLSSGNLPCERSGKTTWPRNVGFEQRVAREAFVL